MLILLVLSLLSLASGEPAWGQINMEVELEHLLSLYRQGDWLEAETEAGQLFADTGERGGRRGGQLANAYLTFGVLHATFASKTEDIATATTTLEVIEKLFKDRRFMADVARSPGGTPQLALLRSCYLIDAQIRMALVEKRFDDAEKLVATSIQLRRPAQRADQTANDAGNQADALPAAAANRPVLTRLTTSLFTPHRQATLIYLAKDQPSRAKTYFGNMTDDAAAVLRGIFPTTAAAGIPTADRLLEDDSDLPTAAEREGFQVVALIEQTRGGLAWAVGDAEAAERAFDAAIALWRKGHRGDHPDAIPVLVDAAALAIARLEKLPEAPDAKLLAVQSGKVQRLARTARQLAERALTSSGPLSQQITKLLTDADQLASSSTVDLEALEAAEQAASQALRSMEKFLRGGRSVAATASPPKQPQPAAKDDD